MELTNRHKVMLAVAGLGIAGLAADKLFFGVSNPAAANAATGAAEGVARAKQAGAAAEEPPSVADRLEQLAQRESIQPSSQDAAVAGAFSAPTVWYGPSDGNHNERKQSSGGYVLTSVVMGAQSAAIINSHAVRVGQGHPKLPGLTLVSVEQGRAVVEVGGRQITLETSTARLGSGK